jgi:hypothetical protein
VALVAGEFAGYVTIAWDLLDAEVNTGNRVAETLELTCLCRK